MCKNRSVCIHRCKECLNETCSGLPNGINETTVAFHTIIDAHGTIMTASGAHNFTGHHDDDLIGDNLVDFLLFDPQKPRLFSRYDETVTSSITLMHRDGRTISADYTAKPIMHKLTAALIGYSVAFVYKPDTKCCLKRKMEDCS